MVTLLLITLLAASCAKGFTPPEKIGDLRVNTFTKLLSVTCYDGADEVYTIHVYTKNDEKKIEFVVSKVAVLAAVKPGNEIYLKASDKSWQKVTEEIMKELEEKLKPLDHTASKCAYAQSRL
ncbi:MAG: hypothetical protein HYT98_02845 [Candidatus Sungbacteria bacterium]|nr:hypothetical protein [Candidatus Sungbacteria bacterium]